MLKEQTFDTGTVTINYAEGPPSGSPLVLLHSGGDRWQSFLPILCCRLTRRTVESYRTRTSNERWNCLRMVCTCGWRVWATIWGRARGTSRRLCGR
jgi:hypothetical protein